MNQKTAIVALGMSLVLLIVAVSGGMILPLSDQGKDHSSAPEHSPVISEQFDIERVDFIHYAKPTGPAKPAPPAPTCYKLMGIKWKQLPVSYTINTVNTEGLSPDQVNSTLSTSAETWDSVTTRELFSDSFKTANVAYGIRDGKNAIVFGPYSESNVIAVTSVWYSSRTKEIVEFDMLFNDKWEWGNATDNKSLMDLQNIATHEFGHAAGLADLYTDSCTFVTMYGYSGEGDMVKRTLEQPDITGLRAIYGV
jgi:hypothetical protein